MSSFQSTKYDAFAQQLEAAISWLNALGIGTGGSRFGEYRRAVAELIACYKKRDLATANAIFPRVATAVYEANDLIQIHAIAGKYDEQVLLRLREYAAGPNAYQLEDPSNSSNRARNIGFELVVMARLAQARIALDFTVPTDVAARFEGNSLLFECKRPQGGNKIEANLRKAFQQIEEKGRAWPSALGFIAVDISKALNPKFMLYQQPDVERMQAGLAGIVDRTIAEYGRHWQARRSAKTVAVLIRFTCMGAIVGEDNMMTFCQEWGVVPRDEANPDDVRVARGLAAALGAYPQDVIPKC